MSEKIYTSEYFRCNPGESVADAADRAHATLQRLYDDGWELELEDIVGNEGIMYTLSKSDGH